MIIINIVNNIIIKIEFDICIYIYIRQQNKRGFITQFMTASLVVVVVAVTVIQKYSQHILIYKSLT